MEEQFVVVYVSVCFYTAGRFDKELKLRCTIGYMRSGCFDHTTGKFIWFHYLFIFFFSCIWWYTKGMQSFHCM